MSKRIVIALGGNALGNTAAEQLQLVTETAKSIVDLIAAMIFLAQVKDPVKALMELDETKDTRKIF